MVGMALAIATTLALIHKLAGEAAYTGYGWVLLGLLIGGTTGAVMAKRVEMTKMPELVAFMHSMIGLAAVFIAIACVAEPWAFGITPKGGELPTGNRVELFIGAFVGASLRMIEDAKTGGRNFIRLLGRTYTDPQKQIRTLIGQLYAPAMARFKSAFERALPQMPADELVWRLHFMFGTLAYTLAATDTVQLIAGCKPEDRYDARLLEARLTAFLQAGLLAPQHDAAGVKKAA